MRCSFKPFFKWTRNSQFYDKSICYWKDSCNILRLIFFTNNKKILNGHKVVMQGKLFQNCTHLLYCSELSLGGNVNTRHVIHLSHKKINEIFWSIGIYYVNYHNYQKLMLLTSSDTKRTVMHLFLFTNSAQRELVSIFTLSIRFLHYHISRVPSSI